MTFWKVWNKARSTRIPLEGNFAGCSGFLVGGSPRLLEVDLRLLKLPSCWSLAINNAAMIFEPDAFVAIDKVSCFNNNIFTNSKIMKFLNYSRSSELISGKRVCLYPNTFFFDMQNESEMMMSEFCRLDGPLPFWGNTFFTAIALMYQLGFKTIHMIGCDFDTSKGSYAHGKDISRSNSRLNQEIYDDIVEKMKTLVPILKDGDLEVKTCHSNTVLDGICEFNDFVDAIGSVTRASTCIEFNDIKHVNEK